MKKVFLLLVSLVLLSGCTITRMDTKTYDEVIDKVLSLNIKLSNKVGKGYKYYAPRGVVRVDANTYNDVLKRDSTTYYLYVDVVSYYNRVIENYTEDEKAVYSKKINYEDKYGYIEINKWKNGKYLLEIMYNYAKIEVIVDEENIKSAITNAMVVLSSVKYNNNILESIVGENVLATKEIEFNIFETKKNESNFLKVSEEDVYEDKDVPNDPDLVN